MRLCVLTILLCAICLPAEAVEFGGADFGVGVGANAGRDCRDLNREISRSWLTVKDHMAPQLVQREVEQSQDAQQTGKKKKLKRPGRRDFQCMSGQYMKNLIETSSKGSLKLRCFEHPQQGYGGYCCDKQLNECAAYAPRR
jgi:hypothetical protein